MDNATGLTTAYQAHAYAPCDYDFPHSFTGSFNYALPFGAKRRFFNSNKVVSALLGNFQLAGVTTDRSGAPFTPIVSTDVANTGISAQWPTRLGKPKVIGNPSCWFVVASNPGCATAAAGALPSFGTPTQYTYGNGGRNVLRAASLHEVDLNLLKNIEVKDNITVQLRVEAFNLLNHPTFAAPTTTINTGSGGQVSSTLNSSRILQFSAKILF